MPVRGGDRARRRRRRARCCGAPSTSCAPSAPTRPAAVVARRLRERGAANLPRGPRAATRKNPALLTARELEVLELVADGLRNRDIAERLFLAPKTVDHHVSAILRKLGAATRGKAAARAVQLGLAHPGQDR